MHKTLIKFLKRWPPWNWLSIYIILLDIVFNMGLPPLDLYLHPLATCLPPPPLEGHPEIKPTVQFTFLIHEHTTIVLYCSTVN